MPAWRHSLFALVLATRQYPQFALWCELNDKPGRSEYVKALQECWFYHYHKFNHVDLEAAFALIEPLLPMDLETYNEGDSFAFDCAVMLDAALQSVPLNHKGASNASQASLATVIRYCENVYPEQSNTEEELLELIPIQAEMEFQVALMEEVMQPRSPEQVKGLLELALSSGVSSIGLTNDLTLETFAPSFSDNPNVSPLMASRAAHATKSANNTQYSSRATDTTALSGDVYHLTVDADPITVDADPITGDADPITGDAALTEDDDYLTENNDDLSKYAYDYTVADIAADTVNETNNDEDNDTRSESVV